MAATGHEEDDIDHYEVLCLPSGEEGAALTIEQIEKAYRTQSRLRHPDKRPDDPNATADFQLLSSSYKLWIRCRIDFSKYLERFLLRIFRALENCSVSLLNELVRMHSVLPCYYFFI